MSVSSMLSGHHIDAVLDSIVDHSFTSVMVTKAGPDTPIVYVNDAFTELTGYGATEVMGRSPKILQGPETDEKVLSRLRDDLTHGRVFEGKTVNYRSDQSPFTMFWRVFPITDHHDEPVYFVALQTRVDH